MDVDELREELKSAATKNAPLDDARPAIYQRATRVRRTRRRVLSSVVAGSLAAVLVVGFLAFRSDDPRTVRITPARPTMNPTTTTSPPTLTTPATTPSVAPLSEMGGSTDPSLPTGWLRCTNQAAGFSIGAPADWYTSTEGPYQASPGFSGACSFFDPEPFTVDSDVTPQTIQLRFPLGDAFPAQPFGTTVDRYAASATQINEQRDTTVAGNPAVYLDFVAGDGVAKGRHYVCYIVNDDGSALTICTVDAPERTALTFEQRRATLDQAVATLQLSAANQSARPYSLYTHCGVEWAQIDNVWWQANTPLSDGNGNPPAGWGNPFQQGTLTFIDRSTAKFSSPAGDVVFHRTDRTDPAHLCS